MAENFSTVLHSPAMHVSVERLRGSSGWLKNAWVLLVTVALIAVNLWILAYAEDGSTGQSDSPKPSALPIKLTLEAQESIYSSRQGLMMNLVIKATRRARVCLAKDIMTQLQVKVNKSGQNIPLKPLVLRDNTTLFQQPVVVKWLEAGEQLTYRIDVKRYGFADGTPWVPGEYSVTAAYPLCEQNEEPIYDPAGSEILIRSVKPAWFMIMS